MYISIVSSLFILSQATLIIDSNGRVLGETQEVIRTSSGDRILAGENVLTTGGDRIIRSGGRAIRVVGSSIERDELDTLFDPVRRVEFPQQQQQLPQQVPQQQIPQQQPPVNNIPGSPAPSNAAQRPSNVPICDFYTQALFKDNTDANQLKLLTKLVNTVVIGNYTAGTTVPVPGILAPGQFNGQDVNLLGFFDGTRGPTTNVNGVATAGINFLDDGGAEPLKQDKPANTQSSRQFTLLTHLYSFFGTAIGCSKIAAGSQFSPYAGQPSMLETHKFMNLNINQLGYFTQQLGLAAKSFGVADADIQIIADLMNNVFNVRCGKPSSPFQPLSGVQSFCLAEGCPLAKDVDEQCAKTPAGAPTSGAAPGTSTSAPRASTTALASGDIPMKSISFGAVMAFVLLM